MPALCNVSAYFCGKKVTVLFMYHTHNRSKNLYYYTCVIGLTIHTLFL